MYYGKILWLEMWNSFVFIYVYLLVMYKPEVRSIDTIMKGIGLALVLYVCYALCAEAGACLNPALAIA